MGYVGIQDFWVVGSRFFFKRQPIDGVDQPWIDFGVIQEAAPTLTVEKLELEDPDGGRKVLVDETTAKVTEAYNLKCSNFSIPNQEILFLAGPAEAASQTGATLTGVDHEAYVGQISKMLDSAGEKIYNATSFNGITIAGATLGSTLTIVDINAVTGKITLDTGEAVGLSPGDPIMVFDTNLTDLANAGTYEIDSISTDVLTLIPASAAQLSSSQDMSSSNGALKSGTAGELYIKGVDYEVTSFDRGFFRMIGGGAFVADATVEVWCAIGAISGTRKIVPQSQTDIKGEALLMFSRDDGDSQSVREIPLLSLTPASPNLTADAYSDWSVEAKVLSDPSLSEPVGDLVYFKGNLPS